ncbi:hypothetical protein RZO07_16540 [Pseudomonas protegens]|uniref:hypothetical protein n=1 Tax=Pseudomonas protegens TaxID=380021 RepID=UPI0029372F81|nr:hypothetical protein [Pseudomonas protegens]WOE76951.1 hypothetical protein RZO07_16540 [Pseudomonas protegens]
MSKPAAGTTKKRIFSRNDYLAPLPVPTGQKPSDMLNIIWRKNEVFLDIGNYSIGSAVMGLWPLVMLSAFMGYLFRHDHDEMHIFAVMTTLVIGIPTLLLIYSLYRQVPLPIRFNRQRREVCVPREDGEYWIVPWESVTAAATQHSSVSQAGKNTMGLLFIGFENPDPTAKEGNKHFYWGFNCGGGTSAMALWECVRSYMELGPQALPVTNDFEGGRERLGGKSVFWGICRDYLDGIRQHLMAQEVGQAVWLVIAAVLLGAPLAMMLQTWKLSPPPDLTDPAIIEWSKPLPPQQWAKPSLELCAAIAEREAELTAQAQST